jgi:signal transduction histidine kinase
VEQRTGELRDTVQQLETFSYSVVHDMRAPLRAMRSFANVLADDYGPQLDDLARSYLTRIRESAARMDALITDVLSYSRVSSTHAAQTRVNLDALVHEIVEQYPEFQNCAECFAIASPLPPVLGNRALLTQCISNLLGNAMKFVPPGRKPEVRVRAEKSESKVRFWVEDNGIGIDPEFHDRIFELFQRLHRPDEYTGTGVGLAIVKRAVERMHGTIGVESEPGKGSRFWLELMAAD